jgi:hypothetical protein
LVGIKDFSGFPLGSFRGDGGLFDEHDGNFIAHWIDPAAGLAFQTVIVGSGLHRSLAEWANENVQKVLRDGHAGLRDVESSL